MNCVHEGVTKSLQAIARSDQEVRFWFTEGKKHDLFRKRAKFQVKTKGQSLVLTPYTSGSRPFSSKTSRYTFK